MKAILTKDDVAAAISKLKAAGKKTTLQAIHAALDNRGSISTLVRLKAEVEAGAVAERDSEEGLRAFRDLWALAIDEGKKVKEAEIAELREALDATADEAERAQGETLAVRERLTAIEAQRDSLISDLAAANAAVTTSRADGAEHSSKIAEVLERVAKLQESHAHDRQRLELEIRTEHDRAHKLEIELAKLQAVSEAAKAKK